MKKRNRIFKTIFICVLFILPGVWAENGRRTVTLWTFAPNNAMVWESRKSDIEQRFNVNLGIEQIAQNVFLQKLQAEMVGGNPPDIIDWMIENNRVMSSDPDKSLVLPLEEYTRRSPVFSNIPAGRTAWCTYREHIYGLPRDVHPVVLVYNDTLWKSVGIDLARIKTWDEFFTAAKKLTAERSGGKPVHYALPYAHNGLQTSCYMIWQQTGADILDSTGSPQFTSPEFTAFVKKWREWTASGVFCDWDWGQFGRMLANGTLASYTAPDWWVSQVDQGAREGKYQFRVRPLPVYREGGPRTASWGGSFLAIPKTADDPALLYDIIEYMQYDVEASKKWLGDTGMIPPVPEVWADQSLQKPDRRFGGQNLVQIQCELAPEMPVMKTGDIFWDAINDFTEQYSIMVRGRQGMDECLKRTQEAVEQRLR